MSEILSWVDDPDKVAEVRPVMRVNRKAWFIRLYLWIWGADPKKINSCKLWWLLVVLGLPALIVRVATLPIVFLVTKAIEPAWDRFKAWKEARGNGIEKMSIDEVRRELAERKAHEKEREERREHRAELRAERRKARKERRQRRREAAFSHIAVHGDRAVGVGQLIWSALKWTWPVTKYPLWALGVIGGLGIALGVGLVIYQAILIAPWILFMEIILGAVAIAMVFFGGMLFAHSQPAATIGTQVKGGTTGFFQVVSRSAKATHHRTCAVVEVVDE